MITIRRYDKPGKSEAVVVALKDVVVHDRFGNSNEVVAGQRYLVAGKYDKTLFRKIAVKKEAQDG